MNADLTPLLIAFIAGWIAFVHNISASVSRIATAHLHGRVIASRICNPTAASRATKPAMADPTDDRNPVTAAHADDTPDVMPSQMPDAPDLIDSHAADAADLIDSHTPDRNAVTAFHTSMVLALTVSQFRAIAIATAATAAMISPIGPRAMSQAAAIRTAAAVACAPISTHPAATLIAFATAAAPIATHENTT